MINQIHNEDCLITMSKMPNDFVDYSLTSPPYNVGKNSLDGEGKKYQSIDDKMTGEEYFENQKKVKKKNRGTSKSGFMISRFRVPSNVPKNSVAWREKKLRKS